MTVARVLAIAVLASACNEVFDLDPTTLASPTSIPKTCTPIGETPAWSPRLSPVLVRDCTSFMIEAGVVTASCLTPAPNNTYAHDAVEGSLDAVDALVPIPGIPSETGPPNQRQVRRSPDGARLYVPDPYRMRIALYRRGTAAWELAGNLPMVMMLATELSTIASDGARDRLIIMNYMTAIELEGDGGTTWTEIGRFTPAALGLPPQFGFSAFALTPDGLRALVVTDRVYYTDRPTLDDPFRAGELIADLPPTASLYMTADCSRAYVADLGVVFYAERRE